MRRHCVSLALVALSLRQRRRRMAQTAWTGGDDLPTNPLACDDTPGAAAAKRL